MSLTTVIPLLIKLSIVLSVVAIGLRATFKDTTYMFTRPGQLARMLLSMNVIMPAVAIIIAMTFDLHPAVKIALVTLSVSPIPPILPNKMLKAGGSESYTIGLLVAASLLSVILIPLTMNVFEWISKTPMEMKAVDVFMVILTSILVPLLIGIAIRAVSGTFADRVAKPVGLVAMILLVVTCLPILFTSVRAMLGLIFHGTLIALCAFAIIGLVAGHLLGGPEPANRSVLALATSARHPAVALAIVQANFPNQKVSGALILIYLILSAILAVPYLNWVKRSRGQEVSAQRHAEA